MGADPGDTSDEELATSLRELLRSGTGSAEAGSVSRSAGSAEVGSVSRPAGSAEAGSVSRSAATPKVHRASLQALLPYLLQTTEERLGALAQEAPTGTASPAGALYPWRRMDSQSQALGAASCQHRQQQRMLEDWAALIRLEQQAFPESELSNYGDGDEARDAEHLEQQFETMRRQMVLEYQEDPWRRGIRWWKHRMRGHMKARLHRLDLLRRLADEYASGREPRTVPPPSRSPRPVLEGPAPRRQYNAHQSARKARNYARNRERSGQSFSTRGDSTTGSASAGPASDEAPVDSPESASFHTPEDHAED